MISKAYECLTDEKKKETCQKFGNPDGPGSFHVAIAMPSFLLEKKNHVAVLAVFFLVILVIIPTIVIYWYTESSKLDDNGVLHENKRIFYQLLNENLIPKVDLILKFFFFFANNYYFKKFCPNILAHAMEME